MTTKSQIKKLLAPLVLRNPDLKISGNTLYIKPIKSVYCGIYFQSSRSAQKFYPTLFQLELCGAYADISQGLTDRILAPKGSVWDWGDQALMSHLVGLIERDELPKLRTLTSLATYVADDRKFRLSETSDVYFYFLNLPAIIASGDLDRAREMVRTKIEPFDIDEFEIKVRDRRPLAGHMLRRYKRLVPPLHAGDIPAIVSILREFEVSTVSWLGLAFDWQPTPFPLEEKHF